MVWGCTPGCRRTVSVRTRVGRWPVCRGGQRRPAGRLCAWRPGRVRGRTAPVGAALAAPGVATVVVEHRDRLGGMNVGLVEAALSAHGRRLVVLDDGEVDDGLVRDMVEVLTGFCARLYGRRSARNRAEKALRCAAGDVGPRAVAAVGDEDRDA